jgi:hypothetical protein
VALDGVRNPHCNCVSEDIRYSALADFPHYFDRYQLYHLPSDVLEQDYLVGDPSSCRPLGPMREELPRLLETLLHAFAEFRTGWDKT